MKKQKKYLLWFFVVVLSPMAQNALCSETAVGNVDISGNYMAETTASGSATETVQLVKKIDRQQIVLKQTGNSITGFDSTGKVRINGTREGNIVKFYIIRGNEISGTWEINADASGLTGKWETNGGGGATGNWNLAKQPGYPSDINADPPVIYDVSGTYLSNIDGRGNTEFTRKNKNTNVTIVQTGNQIKGTFGDAGEIEGVLENDTVTFDWYYSYIAGTGEWKVQDAGTRMAGKWQYKQSSHNGNWSLIKSDSSSIATAATSASSADVDQSTAINLSGVYVGADGELVKIQQSGDSITGSFGEYGGTLKGTLYGDTIKFKWDRKIKRSGRWINGNGQLQVSNGGTRLKGNWWDTSSVTRHGEWDLSKKSTPVQTSNAFVSDLPEQMSTAEMPENLTPGAPPECEISEEARKALSEASQAWRKAAYSNTGVYDLIKRAEALASPPACDSQRVLALTNEIKRWIDRPQVDESSLSSTMFVEDTGCDVSSAAKSEINDVVEAWIRARFVAEANDLIATAWQQVSSPLCDDARAIELARQAGVLLYQPENRYKEPSKKNVDGRIDKTSKDCREVAGMLGGGGGGGGGGIGVVIIIALTAVTSTVTTVGCVLSSSTIALDGALEDLPEIPDEKLRLIEFAAINQDRLATDISRGGGEYLTILGTMHDCEPAAFDRYDEVTQKSFPNIFPQARMAPEMMLILIESQIGKDAILKDQCSPVYF